MKYFLLSLTLLLSSCSYCKWVTVEKGQVVNENRRVIDIIGNPVMSCYDSYNRLVAEGYFVEQDEDGSFLIDEYGKRYVTVRNPKCRLGK